MKNKISHSKINTYLTCPRKFKYHYVEKLRGNTTSGALLIGSAIDKGINKLIETKNLEEAIKAFDSEWEYGFINNKRVHLPESEFITYAKKDFDAELLEEKDRMDLGLKCLNKNPLELYQEIQTKKELIGFENLQLHEKQFYNFTNWLCLKRKAHLMLKAYNEKVIPRIKNVIAIQKKMLISGKTGDEIEMYIDLVAELDDGKKYVLDNKTSAMDYEPDSASKSQQLILYYYACNKEGMNLDGVGFLVMYKNIQKNRIKICEKCGHNGTGGRHKTCDNEVSSDKVSTTFPAKMLTKRCDGNWIETIKPECKIDIILNQVTKPAQNLVIQTFIEANNGIKKEVFPPNLDSCYKYGIPCVYSKLCWEGKDDELIKLEEKKND